MASSIPPRDLAARAPLHHNLAQQRCAATLHSRLSPPPFAPAPARHLRLITFGCMGLLNPPPALRPMLDNPEVQVPPRRRVLCLGAATALGALGAGTSLLTSGCSSGLPKTPSRQAVVPFSSALGAGGLPAGWRLHITRPDRPVTRYGLDTLDGRMVLHAQADSATSGVRCDVDIDLSQQPWLRWEWRVDNMATGATAAEDDQDDSPARVVLGFDGDPTRLALRDRLFADQVELFTGEALPFATLVYQWDGQAAPEQVLPYARSSRIRYLVVESGASTTGRWHAYRRNVVADYQRVFGEPPGRLISVGLLTDSDDLKTRAEAWFGDLILE